MSRLLEFLPWVFPDADAEVEVDGVDVGAEVFAHHAVAVVEAHDGIAHVEAEVGAETEHGVGVAIVAGEGGDVDFGCADAEVGRDDHSVLFVGKGEGVACCNALEGEVAFGERMVVVEVEVAIGDAGIEAEVVVDAFGELDGDVRHDDVRSEADGEGRLLGFAESMPYAASNAASSSGVMER